MNKFNKPSYTGYPYMVQHCQGIRKMVEKKMVYKTWPFTSVIFFGEQINKELTLYGRHTICPGLIYVAVVNTMID